MAEVCKKCFYKDFSDLVKKNEKVVMSKYKDICDSCGEYNYTVDRVGSKGFFDSLVEFIERIGV